MRCFLKQLDTVTMNHRTKRVVPALGVGGVVGSPQPGSSSWWQPSALDMREAKGVDATLRSFTQRPVGPWLLVAVVTRLIRSGVFSFASARRRRL